ncbi:hypothetical protein HJC23_000224 [Cyclotella cryptica]|uniref:Uncharacterized protein n=1 Tax=Cyclotella cryptica TaxID=29204 RepID=A0ABD3PRS7_9STRA|eukprot:CCRYP_013389-RA/>CCRYP_013389-RA protein AED:0.04 eAED:0.04 QI:225/1/1/1/1/1/2/562/209
MAVQTHSWIHCLVPVFLLIWTPHPTKGFVNPSAAISTCRTTSMQTMSTQLHATRRGILTQSVLATSFAVLTTLPLPSNAKTSEPITRALVTETFASIREELTSSSGVVATLQKLIDGGNYDDILQYTKESDAFFRKGKLGKARKLLTDDKLKGDSVLMSNAVTFDLIGINRASRPGKENKEEQQRYLQELKSDVEKFLELESTIVVVDE